MCDAEANLPHKRIYGQAAKWEVRTGPSEMDGTNKDLNYYTDGLAPSDSSTYQRTIRDICLTLIELTFVHTQRLCVSCEVRTAHTVYLCGQSVPHSKQRLFPHTALTGWAL
jgi:hypothetical protein